MAVKPDPKDGFQWYHEGVAILAATFGLLWSAAILTINYVTIPGYEPKQIDPTFPSSIFTLTLGALGVNGMTKLNDKNKKKKEDEDETNFNMNNYPSPK